MRHSVQMHFICASELWKRCCLLLYYAGFELGRPFALLLW